MKSLSKPTLLICLTAVMAFFLGIQEGIAQTEQETFKEVDQLPEYPGGQTAMYQFMAENLKYPSAAREKGIEGTVVVSYIVNVDGSISNPEILRGIGGGCDEEAIRIVKAFPTWSPGIKDGKKVRTEMRLPIRYKL